MKKFTAFISKTETILALIGLVTIAAFLAFMRAAYIYQTVFEPLEK